MFEGFYLKKKKLALARITRFIYLKSVFPLIENNVTSCFCRGRDSGLAHIFLQFWTIALPPAGANIISVQLLPVYIFSMFSVFYVTLSKLNVSGVLSITSRSESDQRFVTTHVTFLCVSALITIHWNFLFKKKGREQGKWNSRWYHT